MPIDPDRLHTGGAFDGPLARTSLRPLPPLRELAPGERIGPFRIQREVSRGGMGIVYLAVRDDGEFEQRVALKWMSRTRDRSVAEALFRRERDILASLEHPGIARLVDGGREPDGGLWFAMEYVEGEPIDRWCARRGTSIADRVALLEKLCEALSFAHRRLLIHRDIKPANVLVDGEARVKLLDFGIARLVDQRELLGGRALTPTYASPEQWSGDEVTVASDVYQLGLLSASVLGVLDPGDRRGHATRSADDALQAGEPVTVDRRRLAPLGRELAAILAKATALRVEQRYESVDALATEFARWRQRRPVAALGGGWTYTAACAARRHPMFAVAATVGAAALVTLGVRLAIAHERAVDEASRAREAMSFITEVLKWADPGENRGAPLTVAQALARGAEQLDAAPGSRPEHAAEIALLLGAIHVGRRDRDAARPLLERAYTGLRRTEDTDPALLAKSAHLLGSVLGDSADRARSIALLDEAIALCAGNRAPLETCVEAHRVRAIRISSNGDVASALAELDAGLALLDPRDPGFERQRLSLLRTKAATVPDSGDPATMLALRHEILAAATRAYGPVHPVVSDARGAYIYALIREDRFEEAEGEVADEISRRATLWGTMHSDYAVALNIRGFLAYRRDQLDLAARDVQHAIDIATADGARGRQHLASFHELLGLVERGRGDLVRAADSLRRAIDPDLASTSMSLDHGRRRLALAKTLLDLGESSEAEAVLAVAHAEVAALPEVHGRRTELLVVGARLAELQGDTRRARALIEAAMQRASGAGASPLSEAARTELEAAFDRLHHAGPGLPSTEGPF